MSARLRLSTWYVSWVCACQVSVESHAGAGVASDDAATAMASDGSIAVASRDGLGTAATHAASLQLDAGRNAYVDAGSLRDASPTVDAAYPRMDAAVGGDADASSMSVPPKNEFSYVPSGVAARVEASGWAPNAVLDCGDVHIDTSASAPITRWCGPAPITSVLEQTDGPEVLVIRLSGLTVAAQTTVTVTGTRPVLFWVKGDVTIHGDVDASARGEQPGPGGNFACGASAGMGGAGREGHNGAGGGGGGFGTGGGAGGTDDGAGSKPGMGGAARGDVALVPLLGGCMGGFGGGCYGHPGAGGGAVQISASGSLHVFGSVAVEGGAGSKGCYLSAGGTGGGSGGAILLEARVIDITGARMRAWGGLGGQGANGAPAGTAAMSAGEPGGEGGVFYTGGGGGGGGYGRIRLRAAQGCTGCE